MLLGKRLNWVDKEYCTQITKEKEARMNIIIKFFRALLID